MKIRCFSTWFDLLENVLMQPAMCANVATYMWWHPSYVVYIFHFTFIHVTYQCSICVAPIYFGNQMKNKKINCRNSTKIVERGKIDIPQHTNTLPLTFLDWYRHFSKTWRGYISFIGTVLNTISCRMSSHVLSILKVLFTMIAVSQLWN